MVGKVSTVPCVMPLIDRHVATGEAVPRIGEVPVTFEQTGKEKKMCKFNGFCLLAIGR